NVDFADARLLGSSSTPFGDLVIHDYASFDANGLTVRQFLAQADLALGGGLPSYDYTSAALLLGNLNASFSSADGTPSQFAQDHLGMTMTPAPVPEPATISLLGLGLAGVAARRRTLMRRE